MAEELKVEIEKYYRAFKDAFDEWLDPMHYHTVSWRDVEDARRAVVAHCSDLARAKIGPYRPGDDAGSSQTQAQSAS